MFSNQSDFREEMFDRFVTILRTAAARVTSPYMQLPVSYQSLPIYRERVYCYELYHQLRCLMTDFGCYSLGGEVDKSGHRHMNHENIKRKIPDLLVHRPGHMDGNLVVIEVKSIVSRIENIKKDLETIEAFLAHGNYYRGIYLIYGSYSRNAKRLSRIYRLIQEYPHAAEHATLFWHRAPEHIIQQVNVDSVIAG